MAPRAARNDENKCCIKCGKVAEIKYRRQWFCGMCLNPEPTVEYLKTERERANGQWGGTGHDSWTKM